MTSERNNDFNSRLLKGNRSVSPTFSHMQNGPKGIDKHTVVKPWEKKVLHTLPCFCEALCDVLPGKTLLVDLDTNVREFRTICTSVSERLIHLRSTLYLALFSFLLKILKLFRFKCWGIQIFICRDVRDVQQQMFEILHLSFPVFCFLFIFVFCLYKMSMHCYFRPH